VSRRALSGNAVFTPLWERRAAPKRASFTFRFFSIDQLRDCLAYYERKTHPSSRLPIAGDIDHWEAQRWFERLPMYLLEEPKRVKVVKALGRALTFAESGSFSKMSVSDKRS
jgi:hypothetical protein